MINQQKCVVGIAIIVLSAYVAFSQDMYPAQRLHSPATIRNKIGGESHAVYVIRVKKGQRLIVKLWYDPNQITDDVTLERGSTASFGVMKGSHLDSAKIIKYGKFTNNSRTWVAKIRRTGNYLIDVIAHPIAKFTLRVKTK